MWAGIFLLLALILPCIRYGAAAFGVGRASLLLLLKFLAGFIPLIFYFNVEQAGDLLFYHHEALEGVTAVDAGFPLFKWLGQEADIEAKTTPQARSFFFIKVLVTIYWILGPHPWLASLLFSLLAFSAGVYFMRRLRFLYPDLSAASILVFFLWPSIAIWGSGMGKESLMLSALLLFAGALFPMFAGDKKFHFGPLLLTAVSLFVLVKLRFFVVLLILPSIFGYFLVTTLRKLNFSRALAYLLAFLTMGFAIFLLSLADYSFHPRYILEALANNRAVVVENSWPGHVVQGLRESEPAILPLQIILAAVAGIFGPFPWELSGWKEGLLMVSPLVLVFFLIQANWQQIRRIRTEVLVFGGICVLGLSAAVTFANPNYGSLSRYSLAWYPILLIICSYGHPWLAPIRRLFPVREGHE